MASAQRSSFYADPRSPPGQGHFPSYPSPTSSSYRGDGDGYDYGYDRAPPRSGPNRHPPQRRQPYFDPPPTEAYPPAPESDERYHDDPREQYDERFPDDRYAEDRGPPAAAEEAALTPYDDEKAEAEWRRGVEEAYARQPPPREPPPNDYEERRAELEAREREREVQMQKQREYELERQRQIERDRYYDEIERERELDRQYERERRRRREEEMMMREKALRYPSDPKKGGRDFFGSSEGERGVAAELAGGAGGAWIGHEISDSAMGTVGGLVVGALAAKVLEKQYQSRKNKKEMRRGSKEIPYPPPGRDMDDVRRSGRDGARSRRRDSSEPPASEREEVDRGRRSQSKGLKDRVMRSLSRLRSKSRGGGGGGGGRGGRRRSPSYDSEDTLDR
ncbi:Hypothetical predicted protein [Lecanosticta acicola]|uniref:Glycine zipper 2TM domain-containing protein n=1 Tax=Lecanosticta acicola TaxID=111012 RepID=A0AAI8Z4B5_9PEZI|nr:Hypothetical predicted protein [Lecanosticta acicola]